MPDNSAILHELLKLQRDSNERDSRIEGKMDSLSTRVQNIESHSEKQDKQIDKLTEILSEQNILSHKIDALTNSLSTSNQKQIEKNQKTEAIIATLTHEIEMLKNANGKIALSAWKKIGGIILNITIPAIFGYIAGKFGGN